MRILSFDCCCSLISLLVLLSWLSSKKWCDDNFRRSVQCASVRLISRIPIQMSRMRILAHYLREMCVCVCVCLCYCSKCVCVCSFYIDSTKRYTYIYIYSHYCTRKKSSTAERNTIDQTRIWFDCDYMQPIVRWRRMWWFLLMLLLSLQTHKIEMNCSCL